MKLLLPLSENGRPILAFIARQEGDIYFIREQDKDRVIVSKDCYALLYNGLDYETKGKFAEVKQDNYFFAIDVLLTLLDMECMNKYEHFLPVKDAGEALDVEWRYSK